MKKEPTELPKVNDRQLRKTLPTLLTPPHLNMWERSIQRDRNEYHQTKFRKNNPSLEQQKFQNVVNALTEYKETQEQHWKNGGNNHSRRNNNFF